MIQATTSTFIRPLLNVLRARKWIVLAAVIALPLAAAAFTSQQDAEYEATSQVLISRTNLSNVLTGTNDPAATEFDFNRVIQTQATLARIPRVAQRTLIAAERDRSAFAAFLDRSSVVASPNNNLLTFTVTDGRRDEAILLAREYARQFVAYKQAATTNRLELLRDDLESEYVTLDPDSAEARQNRVQLVRVRNLIALGDTSVAVVQTPRKAEKTKPKPVRTIILALILGMVLGVGLAFLRDALDSRLRTSDELEKRLDLPLLGRIPSPSRKLSEKDSLVTISDPASPDAEPFRALRSGIAFAGVDQRAQAILIVSAVQSEGKSTTIANLAVTMARAGQNVILADFDFRRPYIERFFGLTREPGSTDVVLGKSTIAQVLRGVDIDSVRQASATAESNGSSPAENPVEAPAANVVRAGSLRVLTTGELPPTVGEFVSSQTLGTLLTDLRHECDTLLIDAPPVLAVSDAMALTDHVDAFLLVTRLGVVRRQMLNEVKRLLGASPTPTLGFVITDAALDPGGYGYGYGYDYGEPAGGSRSRRPRIRRGARKRAQSPSTGVT